MVVLFFFSPRFLHLTCSRTGTPCTLPISLLLISFQRLFAPPLLGFLCLPFACSIFLRDTIFCSPASGTLILCSCPLAPIEPSSVPLPLPPSLQNPFCLWSPASDPLPPLPYLCSSAQFLHCQIISGAPSVPHTPAEVCTRTHNTHTHTNIHTHTYTHIHTHTHTHRDTHTHTHTHTHT
jgi:hypothetical protein